MKLHIIIMSSSLIISLTFPTLALAQWDQCNVSTVAVTQASMCTLPNGQGMVFAGCYVFGGALTDATITLTILDPQFTPIVGYPAEDMWLESADGGLVLCPNGSIADAETDMNGQATFSGPICGGGASQAGLMTMLTDDYCDDYFTVPLNIIVNSPDINGDLVVNLTDVVLFSQVFYGDYDYAADFHWDGAINLSDVVLMGQAIGATCP